MSKTRQQEYLGNHSCRGRIHLKPPPGAYSLHPMFALFFDLTLRLAATT